MLTKSILKIWLLSINFKKFNSINLWMDQSEHFMHWTDWFDHKFIDVNFSKFTDANQIFRNDFDCIHYHLCTISSRIIECKDFAPYNFLEIDSSYN